MGYGYNGYNDCSMAVEWLEELAGFPSSESRFPRRFTRHFRRTHDPLTKNMYTVYYTLQEAAANLFDGHVLEALDACG